MTEVLDTVLIVVHIMLVVTLIALVLLQKSEGGALGIGGGGGGGGGGGFMSARSAADTLTKTTTIVAGAFFLTSILLGVTNKSASFSESVIERVEGGQNTGVPTESGTTAPAAPAGGNLLEDLKKEAPAAPSTGVPTSE